MSDKEIKITDIISIESSEKYKFHAARWNGQDQPLDVYVRDKDEWHYWNRWRSNKDEFSREYIFSLIDFYPETDTWLFGGIYKVLKRNNISQDFSYEIDEIEKYSPYVGRLKVKLKKPPRGRAFYLENYIENMHVSEILKETYSGECFPGYDYISKDFHELQAIFIREKPDWKTALENIKGVYLIVDKKCGKKYVGSAYGSFGIWSRWKCYVGTGHGWNDELTKIINSEGIDYAKKYFKVTLLEYMPMKSDDAYVIERECFWKEALLARGKFGYNKN
ncbi:MAG: GIY-YIG nuclease family protein [Spirochaetia bacterium]|nr:GIY-YIG nuclease family protein [Spirochaetia bacterium]MCF7953289.1 GIY-YIG nuclease family protein [Spirochaetales bacterium]MCF8232757.1 GIY-YIG nuclease family protein [Bacteroidales bacterium]